MLSSKLNRKIYDCYVISSQTFSAIKLASNDKSWLVQISKYCISQNSKQLSLVQVTLDPRERMSSEQVVPVPLLNTESAMCYCAYCGRTGPTKIETKTGLLTWLSCYTLTLGGCWLGCCLIPFFVDNFKDVQHRCSSCQQVLNTYEKPL